MSDTDNIPALRAVGLRKHYGTGEGLVRAVDSVDLDVAPGETVGGFALFYAINAITGGDSDRATFPSLWQLLALVAGTVFVVAALTAVPARLGGRRPVTETLQAELA